MSWGIASRNLAGGEDAGGGDPTQRGSQSNGPSQFMILLRLFFEQHHLEPKNSSLFAAAGD